VRTDLQPARDIFGSKAGRRQYLDMSRQICDLLSTNKGRELVADLHEFVGNLVGNRVCDQVLCDLDTGSVMESGLFSVTTVTPPQSLFRQPMQAVQNKQM